eukprot:maker-scaffold521_size146803-snap-gene-0.11 protein:Tk12185 transcript:maker-scaffold521_size146803-snap-gene-0.11-mRNA-1 annotation:"hypothetical protein LOTGIDRAFT_233055"
MVEAFLSQLHQVQNNLEVASLEGQLDLQLGGHLLASDGLTFHTSHFECHPGTMIRGNMCVNCPIGTYFNVVNETCAACSPGSYQPQEAQLTCMVCPSQRSTIQRGAKSRVDCKAQCLPGTYSADGLSPCSTCSFGHFQPLYAQNECLSCPEGFSTEQRGSRLAAHCLALCSLGEVSENGLQPCFPCPIGYFQPFQGQTGCIQCLGDTCQEGHHPNVLMLRSLPRLEVNDCFTQPCRNGATCQALKVGFQCLCPPSHKGMFCETPNDLCASNPCLNGGFCSMNYPIGQYICTCPNGFSGHLCEIDTDECLALPCRNGASCVDGIDTFTCLCPDGFQGPTCDDNIDDCVLDACFNGGICIDGTAAFACQCLPGFSGRYCQLDIDDCASSPCQNGGTCLDNIHAYDCVCPMGFQGQECELSSEVKGDCTESRPCRNGGSCEGNRCFCPFRWAGKSCERELHGNFSLHFGSHYASKNMDYVQIHRVVPDLDQLSFCFWMRTTDQDNYGTPISYAVPGQDNELTFTDYSGFVLAIKGEKIVTDVTANDGSWHRLCVSWKSQNGWWNIAKDGQNVDRGNGLATNRTITGRGILILGQEQDYLGGNFSALESFRGELTGFDFWSKVSKLSEDEEDPTELWPIREQCLSPSPSATLEEQFKLFDWTDALQDIHGLIEVRPLDLCSQRCPKLVDPINGSISEMENGPYLRLQISCLPGFVLVEDEDDGIRICTPMGEWTGGTGSNLVPKCREIYCGYPGFITNGFIVGSSSYGFGDRITFSCRPGFALKGPPHKTCGNQEQWEPSGTTTCQ